MKRILLLVATNVAVLVVISIVLRLFGVGSLRLGEPEVEAVLGHEITHVANGDMVR